MGVWETAKDKQDVIKLFTVIHYICHCHNKTKQGTISYVKSYITLYTTFQKPNKSLEYFLTKLNAQNDTTKANGRWGVYHSKLMQMHIANICEENITALKDTTDDM